MKTSGILLFPLALLLSGCGGNDFQSALHPASEEAKSISWLWWMMVVVYGLVFLVTLGLAGMAILKRKSIDKAPTEAPGGPVKFVVVAGIVVPSIILLGILVYSLRASSAMRAPETEFTIEVTGHRWWWDVRYPDHGIVSANEIRIPVGVPVRLDLSSADVIHSFWVPNLHGKMDMMPDHVSRFWLQAERTGLFRGACAEFCGDQHARMGLDVYVMPRDEFDAWAAARGAPPAEAAAQARGHDVFFAAGCAACHAIGGTEAVANVGPDLTHLAERRHLAAAFLPNNPENLARWILEPQVLKPGNLMPPSHLAPDELQALVDYLLTPR
ncbi:MAG: cytochrome c oxidase subunit II [Akkermansiaceae bacterium]